MNPGKHETPKIGERILKFLLFQEERYEKLGDFEETFVQLVKEEGTLKARIWYWFQIIAAVPAFIENMIYWRTIMLRNYVKTAFRNIKRFKVYSIINITGLSIGIMFCILSFLFIRHEFSYDIFHENADTLYLTRIGYGSSDRKPTGATPPCLAPFLSGKIPEIGKICRVYGWGIQEGTPVKYNDKLFNMSGFLVDPSFFEMFTFPRISGDLNSSLDNLNSVVISKKMAGIYFDNEEPLGKSLSINVRGKMYDFSVTGVVDIPKNSSFSFDFLVSYKIRGESPEYWFAWNVYTFVLVNNTAAVSDVENKFISLFEQHFSEQVRNNHRYFGDKNNRLRLLMFTDLYLNTEIRPWLMRRSNPLFSYIISGIALAVLLIACVNFMNLSLGLSSTRFKEVGMRKVVGATRINLLRQFLSESVLLSVVALLAGILLIFLLLPAFNDVMNRNLSFELRYVWGIFLGLAFLIGFLTGSYPALVMSGFHPAEVLKGKLKIGGANNFTKGLVIFQFSLSIVLIVSTLLMTRQMDFLRKKDLGFNFDYVVVIDSGGLGVSIGNEVRQRLLQTYRRQAAQYSTIQSISVGNMIFNKGRAGTGLEYNGENISCGTFTVDYDFIKTLKINLIQGRDFSPDFPSDEKESIVVNESFVKACGFDEPIGKKLATGNSFVDGTIIGVVEDFHQQSLHHEILPAAFKLREGNGHLRFIVVRISPENVSSTLTLLESTWQQLVPDRPFIYSFLDEDVEKVFQEDERWVKIARWSSVLAIFIACLGAFGLTSLTVARRTKEVGIRKVVGASIGKIVILLSKEFMIFVLIANLISWPLTYFIVNDWLQDFAYRINPGLDIFIFGAFLVLFIVLFTISFQVIKAARANPVEALKYE